MSNFKIDWNDHISQFIRIKAKQPHVITALVQLQQKHKEQKSQRRRADHIRAKLDNLAVGLRQETQKLEGLRHGKVLMNAEMARLENDSKKLEWEIQRLGRQMQESRKIKGSRVSLAGTNSTSSQSLLAFGRKQAQTKAHNLELAKQQTRNELSHLIAQRISIREELELFKRKIIKFQAGNRHGAQHIVSRQELTSLKIKQEELKSQRQHLLELQHQRSSPLHRPFKITKKETQLLNESTKKLQAFIKEAKKLIMSDKTRTSRRYQEFLQKYHHKGREDLHVLQNQLKRLEEKHFQLKIISDEANNVLIMGKYQELQHQMLAQCSKKDINPQSIAEIHHALELTLDRIVQTQQQQAHLIEQIRHLQMNLQKKDLDILHQSQNRRKSNQSL